MRYVVNMLHMLSYGRQGGGGWGGVITVLMNITHGPRNLLPLLTCCTCLSYGQQGGVITFSASITQGPRLTCFWRALGSCMRHSVALFESVAAALPKALWQWCFEEKWMDDLVDVCVGNLKIINSQCFFKALEEQNWFTAQAKCTFLNLSHTPANRNECPCCKHVLTSPTNTSILSI